MNTPATKPKLNKRIALHIMVQHGFDYRRAEKTYDELMRRKAISDKQTRMYVIHKDGSSEIVDLTEWTHD